MSEQPEVIVFYEEGPDIYRQVYTVSTEFNIILQLFTIVINLFHLFILTQKPLRCIAIYILMIAICVSDVTSFSIEVYNQCVELMWVDNLFPMNYEECLRPDYLEAQPVLSVLYTSLDISRRTSPWLAIMMAFVRTLSVMFPMSRFIQNLARPQSAVVIVMSVFFVCFSYSSWQYTLYRIFWLPDNLSPFCQKFPQNSTKPRYLLALPEYLSERLTELGYLEAVIKFIPTLCYPILTVVLVIQLRNIRNKRQNVRKTDGDKSDNTTRLILFMTVSFMLSEGLAGLQALLMYNYESLVNFDEQLGFCIMASLYPIGNLRTLNALSHPFICFAMSSQYRDCVKSLFPSGKHTKQSFLLEDTTSTNSIFSKRRKSKTF